MMNWKSTMKRFAIFALLWPPIGMFVGAALTEAPGINQAAGMTFALLPLVYLYLIVPAIALAFVDMLLADYPVRLPVVCVVGFFGIAMLFATGSDSNKFLYFGIAGLVPTAICSLLANLKWPDLMRGVRKTEADAG
jgi:hypothetical protein